MQGQAHTVGSVEDLPADADIEVDENGYPTSRAGRCLKRRRSQANDADDAGAAGAADAVEGPPLRRGVAAPSWWCEEGQVQVVPNRGRHVCETEKRRRKKERLQKQEERLQRELAAVKAKLEEAYEESDE